MVQKWWCSNGEQHLDRWKDSQSVYDVYSRSRRRTLLALVAAVYPLLPLSDTILLTQMHTIQQELTASNTAVTATLSLYLLAAAAGFALWGPVADMLGRTLVFHAALILFTGSSVGCALAPNITLFLVGRGFQGLAAAGTWAVGNAVVADIYPIDIRGQAFGIFMSPGMLGPVIAPFIGAALTHAFGWRSMMWFLAILSGALQLVVLLIYRETQQFRVARHLHKHLKQHQITPPDWVLQSMDATQQARPHPRQLLQLLKRLITDPTVLPYLLLQWHTFGCMFLILLQLSEVLAETTSLTPTQIGLCYFVTGFCSVVGSWTGGWAADKAASAPHSASTARVEWSSFTTLLFIPAGLLLVGWIEPAHWRGATAIAVVLVGGSLVCFTSSFVLPGGYSYLSHRAGEFAAAVGSLTAAGTNVWPAALLQLNPLARPTIGIGWYNTIIAVFTAALAAVGCAVCWQQRKVAAHGSSSPGNRPEGQQCDAVVSVA